MWAVRREFCKKMKVFVGKRNKDCVSHHGFVRGRGFQALCWSCGGILKWVATVGVKSGETNWGQLGFLSNLSSGLPILFSSSAYY